MKLLIFDFDGTIADTKSVYYNSIRDSLSMFNLNDEQINRAIDIGMSLRKTLRNLGFGFIVSWYLKRKIMKRVEHYTLKVKKCKDVDSIKNIEEKKILVTNSLKEFVIPILKHLNLKNTFSEIYGADDFSDKAEFISQYIKKNNLKKTECYYLGDRVADIKLARKIGIISIIISGKCAWNSRKELISAKPDILIDDLAGLVDIFH